ncbi:MAG: hypothetical protein ACC742_01105 [Thermoanaerobaculales bacterium]
MMSWTAIVLLVVGIAVLSAVCTTALLTLMADRFLRSRIADQAGAAGDMVAAKVAGAVEASIEEALPRLREEVALGMEQGGEALLPRLRSEVEGGFSDAAERLLPKFREQVRQGFSDALASAVTGGALGKAGEELARKGGSVLDAGLDLLLGKRDP